MDCLTEEEKKELNDKQAKREQANLRAMKLLIEADNDRVITLRVDGLKHAFSSADIFLSIIDNEIQEIQKSIDGKPNKWD